MLHLLTINSILAALNSNQYSRFDSKIHPDNYLVIRTWKTVTNVIRILFYVNDAAVKMPETILNFMFEFTKNSYADDLV